jgi:prophage regulatory protein
MPQDMLDLLRLDPGTRTLGQLVQEREWACGEINRLRHDAAQHHRLVATIPSAPAATEPARGIRYLRLREVCQRVGLKPSSVYRLIALGGFPKQVKLSERTAAWIDSEIEAFMATRIADRDQGPPGGTHPTSRFMRMSEVMKLTGLNSSQIYELIRKGKFPKWANLPKIASGWLRPDIEHWIESRADRRE